MLAAMSEPPPPMECPMTTMQVDIFPLSALPARVFSPFSVVIAAIKLAAPTGCFDAPVVFIMVGRHSGEARRCPARLTEVWTPLRPGTAATPTNGGVALLG